MNEWLMNPDGIGARHTHTGAVCRSISACRVCGVIGSDIEDPWRLADLHRCGIDLDELSVVVADPDGQPICDDCWEEEDHE